MYDMTDVGFIVSREEKITYYEVFQFYSIDFLIKFSKEYYTFDFSINIVRDELNELKSFDHV